MAEAEHVVDAMGTRAHVIVNADDLEMAEVLAHTAVTRLVRLEQQWSRFIPGSELSNLNANAGRPVALSADTLALVERAVEAWHRTDGRFDPTVLPSLLAAGYDRDFRTGLDDHVRPATELKPAPGCGKIEINGRSVTLPTGVMIDPGGIGKGFAADLAVDLVMTAGAIGACVNVGGDLCVAGRPAATERWSVAIEHPLEPRRSLGRVELADEALVSSWRTRRVWGSDDDPRHHLIDPRTGHPAWTGLAGVTVLAPEAWWAEALATALFLAGPEEAPALVARHGIAALLVRDDGAVRAFGRLPRPRPADSGALPMKGHLAWYVARGAGIVTWGLLGRVDDLGPALRDPGVRSPRLVVVAAGSAPVPRRAGGPVHRHPRRRAHRRQLHPLCRHRRARAVQGLVASRRGPWGVIAMYLLVTIEITSLLKARVPHRVWRTVHIGSYPLFALATIHALSSGTDLRAVVGGGVGVALGAIAAALAIIGLDQRSAVDPRRPTRPASASRTAPGLR